MWPAVEQKQSCSKIRFHRFVSIVAEGTFSALPRSKEPFPPEPRLKRFDGVKDAGEGRGGGRRNPELLGAVDVVIAAVQPVQPRGAICC